MITKSAANLRKKLHILRSALALGEFFHRRSVFLSRKQAYDILAVRKPRQHVDCQNEHKRNDDPGVCKHTDLVVTEEKDQSLPDGKPRHAEKGAHRSPFGKSDIPDDPDQKEEKYEQDIPRILTAEAEPE